MEILINPYLLLKNLKNKRIKERKSELDKELDQVSNLSIDTDFIWDTYMKSKSDAEMNCHMSKTLSVQISQRKLELSKLENIKQKLILEVVSFTFINRVT